MSKKYILLDSCIIEYLLNTDLNRNISDYLQTVDDGSDLQAISEITYSELTEGAFKHKEERVFTFLNKFTTFPVNRRVIVGSGKLGTLYRMSNIDVKRIGLADKLIASTAIIQNHAIITSNLRDFPVPYFLISNQKNITIRKRGKNILLPIATLTPNYPYINQLITKRN